MDIITTIFSMDDFTLASRHLGNIQEPPYAPSENTTLENFQSAHPHEIGIRRNPQLPSSLLP